MSVGLLVLRLVLGALFIGHGSQKLFGWFGGGGRNGSAAYFGSLGYRPALAFAMLAGVTEAGCGSLMILGLATPVAAAGIIGVMTNVIAVKWSHGLWEVHDGFEFPLLIQAACMTLAFAGPGIYSVDRVFGFANPAVPVALAAIVVGLVSGFAASRTRKAVAAHV